MHKLIDLLVCPRTKSNLKYVELAQDAALISQADGVLYPIIENVVVMKPSGPDVQKSAQTSWSEITVPFPTWAMGMTQRQPGVSCSLNPTARRLNGIGKKWLTGKLGSKRPWR